MIKCMVKCFSEQLQIESANKKLEIVKKNQGEIWAFKNENWYKKFSREA